MTMATMLLCFLSYITVIFGVLSSNNVYSLNNQAFKLESKESVKDIIPKYMVSDHQNRVFFNDYLSNAVYVYNTLLDQTSVVLSPRKYSNPLDMIAFRDAMDHPRDISA